MALIMHNYQSNKSAIMTRCRTDLCHQYGVFGGKSLTFFTWNATRAGSEEGRLFSQAKELLPDHNPFIALQKDWLVVSSKLQTKQVLVVFFLFLSKYICQIFSKGSIMLLNFRRLWLIFWTVHFFRYVVAIVFCIEHFLILCAVFARCLVCEKPKWVRIAVAKENYERAQEAKEKKEKTD